MTWRGDWSAGTSYRAGDAVAQAGASHVATRRSRGVPVTDAASWAVLAQGGPAGAPSPRGSSPPSTGGRPVTART